MLPQSLFESSNSKTISLYSREGRKLLRLSLYQRNYQLLERKLKFEKQVWISYCGVASTAIVLNAMTDSDLYVQFNPFESDKKQIISPIEVLSGMKLKQLGQLLEEHEMNVRVFFARSTNIEQFRDLAKEYLNKSDCFVIVNYFRKLLDQFGWGHISPLGAYNSEADSFLILDVAQNRSPVWVKTDILYRAMIANDGLFNESRGFVLVTRNTNNYIRK